MLAPRSDTFKVRASGRTFSKSGEQATRAVLEAVVQRTPELIESGPNAPFGRQIKLLSLRWVDTSEL